MAVKECMEKSSANNKGGAALHDEDRSVSNKFFVLF